MPGACRRNGVGRAHDAARHVRVVLGPRRGAAPVRPVAATCVRPDATALFRTGAAALLLALAAAPAHAQRREVVVEAGASQVSPPSGVAGDAARFLVGGLRSSWLRGDGSGVLASFLAGRAMNGGAGGDFLSGEVGAGWWHPLGRGWSAGIRGRGLGFWVGSPFPYRAGAIEGGPSLRLSRRDVSLRLDATAGAGRSRAEVLLTDGDTGGGFGGGHHGGRMGGFPLGEPTSTTTVVRDDLWQYGGAGEVMVRLGPVVGGATGHVHRSAGGTYRSGGVRLIGGSGPLAVMGGVDLWWTPAGRETIVGIALSLPLSGGWSLRGFAGRTEPDPLTLAASSGGGGGVLVGRRIAGEGVRSGSRYRPIHRVISTTHSGARIRIEVHVPHPASSVKVLGDFTLWEPVAMKRTGKRWSVVLDAPAGVHHFGFLVDGEWFVPADAPDVVPDEWGRRTATLVIEP